VTKEYPVQMTNAIHHTLYRLYHSFARIPSFHIKQWIFQLSSFPVQLVSQVFLFISTADLLELFELSGHFSLSLFRKKIPSFDVMIIRASELGKNIKYFKGWEVLYNW
jgi:hypothetical protein